MAGEVVPFGKYKGKPLEAMVQDRQYVDWLLTQPWFRERHANFYTLIVNNFQEPSNTPEHNALQAKFLNAEFRLAFVIFLGARGAAKQLNFEFEHYGFDLDMRGEFDPEKFVHYSIEIKPTVADDYPAVLRQIKSALDQQARDWHEFAQRIKRLPPDTFGKPVLFLQEYTGVGVTCEEFIAIFAASGVAVVFLDEVESLITKT